MFCTQGKFRIGQQAPKGFAMNKSNPSPQGQVQSPWWPLSVDKCNKPKPFAGRRKDNAEHEGEREEGDEDEEELWGV